MTVNTERDPQVMTKFWAALGRRRGINRAEQWFQQDGATPHTSNESLTWLRQRFPDRLISRRCDPEWAPHSPDLCPPDFYLWGYLKDNVYINNPQTISDLKAVITQKIRQIPREECVRVIGNFTRRLQVCLQRGGGTRSTSWSGNKRHKLETWWELHP
ncbi:transposable element tc3 transposase [Plakobranchus ocellatus]|uniref:Transposable element tc3 transposase n=1 Tax=Plakobranchus ocellatus TaxID=259542 RepID=A0AAV3Y332_9GAST|nr:transposable element tc3 transposase [Plakobranchus ocellatus]